LDNDQRTPLLLAASRGCTNAVELLLESGANSILRDAKNRTVLHCAVGHSETLAALLKVCLKILLINPGIRLYEAWIVLFTRGQLYKARIALFTR